MSNEHVHDQIHAARDRTGYAHHGHADDAPYIHSTPHSTPYHSVYDSARAHSWAEAMDPDGNIDPLRGNPYVV